MSGPGRRAALPGPEQRHVRPSALDSAGLVVTHVDEQGEKQRVYDFATLPVGVEMQRDLAEAFAPKLAPIGPWSALSTSGFYWRLTREFAAFLAERDLARHSLAGVTSAVWSAWKLSRNPNSSGLQQITGITVLVRDHPKLPGPVRERMRERVQRVHRAEQAYPPEEFAQIKAAATASFRSALGRIRQNRSHLQRWEQGDFAPDSDQWRLGEALAVLAHTGDVPHHRMRGRGKRWIRAETQRVLGGSDRLHTWQRLYLSATEAVSLTVLMVATYAWNLTSVVELRVPSAHPDPGGDGHRIHRVELEKRRRGVPHRYETHNLADWGADSPGRLISQAIEATAPARELLAAAGAPTDHLLISHMPHGLNERDPVSLFRTGYIGDDRDWDQGRPWVLNFRRLRKTANAQHHRTPIQHTQEVHDSVYVLSDPLTKERAAPVIAAGIADAVEHARQVLVARVATQAAETGQETATAHCTDHTHSPFAPAGSPCRTSFLSCLACPNAVIAPQHLPRLAYLHRALDHLRTVAPDAVWRQDWRDHFERLKDLRVHHSTTAAWADALQATSGADRDLIDRLLNRGFDT